MKTRPIQEILHDEELSAIDKKVAVEKWKFNQLPGWYRKDHKEEILEKIERIRYGSK